ncbi:MAG: hypothetical protein ABH823_03510 [bacterium]
MAGPSKREKNRHFEDFRQPKKVEQGGIIRLSGQFLLDHEEDILSLIKHQAKLAEERNPGQKVTSIKKAKGGIVVQTSDHNLTMHIGKALTKAYKGIHQYKFSKGERFVEVDWQRD